MSEERESIENVYDFIFDGDCYNVVYVYKTYWDEIQKKLKALNIIKEHRINIDDLLEIIESEGKNAYWEYHFMYDGRMQDLTQEEFDLVKEVLL